MQVSARYSRAVGMAAVMIGVGTILSGCLFPTEPARDPMPMVIEIDHTGALVAQFPWCAGDSVLGAGLTATEGRVLRMESEGDPPTSDSVVTMIIDATTFGTGQLTPDLAVAHQLPRLTEYDPEEVVDIFVRTGDFEVSAGMDSLRKAGGQMWLVVGDEWQTDSIVTQIDRPSADEVLEGFCPSD